MTIRIGKTLPPAAAPLRFADILFGIGGIVSGAKTVGNFEKELEEFYRVRHCFAVSSGKSALVMILQALKRLRPDRDEVIIPAYTCYSVPSAIVRAGHRVRLCDTASGSLDFDFELLARQVESPRVLCVIATHLFGVPSDVERVKQLVSPHGIFVVEDAAQAMGGGYRGRKLGTLGDVGLFSLGRGKALSTVEGGIILTDDDQIGEVIGNQLATLPGYGACGCLKLLLYALALSLFIRPWFYWLPKSLPFLKLGETRFDPSFPIMRLSSFQAGLARGWQSKIAKFRAVRTGNARKFADQGLVPAGAPCGTIPDLIRFPVLLADVEIKRQVLRISESLGLGISDGYPDTIDDIEGLVSLSDGNGFPWAHDLVERLLALPIHPLVRDVDIRNIVRSLGSQG